MLQELVLDSNKKIPLICRINCVGGITGCPHVSSGKQEVCSRRMRSRELWPRGLRGCQRKYINLEKISIQKERSRKTVRFHKKISTIVYVFQPSPTRSDSTHMYKKQKRSKLYIHTSALLLFFLVYNVVDLELSDQLCYRCILIKNQGAIKQNEKTVA